MEREQLVKLVTAAQQGDNNSLNQLFNAFYNDVYYFALKTVKDGDLACDITQEAFVEIINTLHNLKEPAAFVTWMKQITYHQCTRYFKKKKDVLVDENEDGETIFDTVKEDNADFIPDEALDKDDFRKTILSILDELSEEQRSATMMYYFDELSVKQIAEIQGVSEGTVKSRLNYARKAIKASVEAYEKKNGIKLHAFPFFPLVHWALESGIESLPLASAEILAGGVAAATGASVSISVGTSAGATVTATATATATATGVTATTAASTAVTATAATATGIGAKIAALPLVTKIIAGITAAIIAVGGGTAAVIIANNNNNNNRNDDSSVSTSSIVEVFGSPAEETLTVLEGVIPEGCTYTLYDGTVLTAGQSFPETCTKGDKVQYGDYYYGYECIFVKDLDGSDGYTDSWINLDETFDTGDSGVTLDDILGCWTPAVIDRTKSSYGEIVRSINGKTINNLFCTFQNCSNMVSAPTIPETVTSISMAFYKCSRLQTAPVIPKSVKRLTGAFWDTGINGEVVINAELDKSLFWYYLDVFRDTYNALNLTGATPEENLFLIAEQSNNPQITVNGKPVVFYYNTNRKSGGIDNLKQLSANVIQFYKDEPQAGYSGDYEGGEECSAIYSAHAVSDHFDLIDIFGYNYDSEDFLLFNRGYTSVYYTFDNTTEMKSDFSLSYNINMDFRTKEEVLTMLEQDIKQFNTLTADETEAYLGNQYLSASPTASDIFDKLSDEDTGLKLRPIQQAVEGSYLNIELDCAEVDGHYQYSVYFSITIPAEIMLAE